MTYCTFVISILAKLAVASHTEAIVQARSLASVTDVSCSGRTVVCGRTERPTTETNDMTG